MPNPIIQTVTGARYEVQPDYPGWIGNAADAVNHVYDRLNSMGGSAVFTVKPVDPDDDRSWSSQEFAARFSMLHVVSVTCRPLA